MHYCVWFFISFAIVIADFIWAGGAIIGSAKPKKKEDKDNDEDEAEVTAVT